MWALKRKLIILFIFLSVLFTAGVFSYFKFFVVKPTCFDGVKNGNEEGIDCGGSCFQICRARATDVNIEWSKSFEVANGISNIAALVENPNFDFDLSATYSIKIFDQDGSRIEDFSRKIKMTPGEKRLIFIPSIVTGEKKVAKTFIEFKNIESLSLGEAIDKNMSVLYKKISSEDGFTILDIGVKNTGLLTEKNIEVSAVIKNQEGSVLDVGRSFIDAINKRGQKSVQITWPRMFEKEGMVIDVYLRKIDF